MSCLFRVSSAVEQWTVNPLVVGSNPTPGDFIRTIRTPGLKDHKDANGQKSFLVSLRSNVQILESG